MIVKKSGGQIYGATLTNAEMKALELETMRMLAEQTRKNELEIEALVIRQLRRHTGWGAVKLKRFFDGFDKDLNDLIKHYEAKDTDAPWLCIAELKNEGFDIEAWHRELHPNERYDVVCKRDRRG